MRIKFHWHAFFVLSLFGTTSFSQVLAPQVDSIPMRDGKKLAADVYIPSGCAQCPVILVQTPYNRIWYRWGLPLGIKLNLNSSNYIFVILDWRGFYGSSAAAHSGSPTRGQDGYDAVQWTAQQSWSNGKVGTWGPSALGRIQYMTAKENPPNLVCIVPQVAGPQYDYQEYFPNGVYRTEYVEQLDALGYGMSTVLLANPVHNNLWTFTEAQNFYPDSIRIPALMIGGWYDHTIQSMLPFFNAIRTQSPVAVRDKHRLLMGPWVHGGHGSSYVGSSTQGQLSYPNAAGWSDSLAMLFFDHHMRNISNGWNNTAYVTYYQMGDNAWMNSSLFPPSGLTNYDLYFHADTSMDLAAPSGSGTSVSYPYDPSNPSPTIGGTTLRSDLEQGPYDQDSAVESRSDVLKFTTAVLAQDVVMKGSARIHLTVSSNRKDTDFDVRLTDVYPDGRSMLLHDGTFRMRFRNGFSAADTAVMIPNTVYTCDIDLPSTCITFKAGHRIRLDVTSSNYPRFNRNANTGNAMYPFGSGDTLVNPLVATNKIYVDGIVNNSYLRLPLTAAPPLAVGSLKEEGLKVEVFPNPSNGEIWVSIALGQVAAAGGCGSLLFVRDNLCFEIYNVLGEKVYEKNMVNRLQTNQLPLTIDISAQPKGMYFLKIKNNVGEKTVKLVVN